MATLGDDLAARQYCRPSRQRQALRRCAAKLLCQRDVARRPRLRMYGIATDRFASACRSTFIDQA